MKTNKLITTLSVILIFSLVPIFAVYAQTGHQQMMQQQNMMHVDQMVKRMEHLRQLSKQMVMDGEMNMRQMEEKQRSDYMIVQHLNESLNAMLNEAHTVLDRYAELNSNEQMMSNRVMQEDMKQLHDHFQDITDQFEVTLHLVDQMNQQLTSGNNNQSTGTSMNK